MYFFKKLLFSTLDTNLWWFLWWKFLQRTLWTLERMPKSSPYLLMASAINNRIKKWSQLLFWSEVWKNSGKIRWFYFNTWRIVMKFCLLINSYLLSLKADESWMVPEFWSELFDKHSCKEHYFLKWLNLNFP